MACSKMAIAKFLLRVLIIYCLVTIVCFFHPIIHSFQSPFRLRARFDRSVKVQHNSTNIETVKSFLRSFAFASSRSTLSNDYSTVELELTTTYTTTPKLAQRNNNDGDDDDENDNYNNNSSSSDDTFLNILGFSSSAGPSKISPSFLVMARSNLHAYSAYYDDVSSPSVVTICGIAPMAWNGRRVTCRYPLTNGWTAGSDVNATVSVVTTGKSRWLETRGKTRKLPDAHNKRMGAVFVYCDLHPALLYPTAVLVLPSTTSKHNPKQQKVANSPSTIALPIIYQGQQRQQQRRSNVTLQQLGPKELVNDTQQELHEELHGQDNNASQLKRNNQRTIANGSQQHLQSESSFDWQLAFCVSPLHSQFDNWKQTLETLELASILGVEHIVVYVRDVSVRVSRVLQYYVTSGLVEVLPWLQPPKDVHYHGQIAAINDCMLRLRHRARWVMFADLDEMVVPRRHVKLPALIDNLMKKKYKSCASTLAAFFVRNVFFPLHNVTRTPAARVHEGVIEKLGRETAKEASELGLVTPLAINRTVHIWPILSRSKVILDPLKVTAMGIHYVVGYTKGSKHRDIPSSMALLHHYRDWTEKNLASPAFEDVRRLKLWKPGKLKTDFSALKFAPQLVERVRNVVKKLALG